jgi:tRNA(fMet)-specific endonuclease VapC
MAVLIDASVFIAVERRGFAPEVAMAPVIGEEALLASITASELLTGVHRADSPQRRLQREAFVEAILELVPVVPFDLGVARTHAQLWSDLAAAGQLIGAHDLQIAATAVAHGCAVLTENQRDFERVPGLAVRQTG